MTALPFRPLILLCKSTTGTTVYRISAALCLLVLLLNQCRSAQAQGLLDRLREDVRAPRPEDEDKPSKEHKKKYHYCEDDDDDDDSSSLFGEALWDLFTVPFWGPIALLESGAEPPDYDLPFPYADASPGYMTYDPTPYYLTDWSLRATSEYGTDLDNLSFVGARGILESTARLGIDSEFRYWHEELAAMRTDNLWTGDANLVFRFARGEKLQMRTGAGVNWLADEIGSDFGFNFTYGGDWFPHRPLIVSADLDWGWISKSELFHARTTVGINVRPVELYTGYDYFDATAFRTHTLIAGLRVWF